jgi:hypothetical protein
MLTAIAILCAVWIGSGFLALTACMLSSRVSRQLDCAEMASSECTDVMQFETAAREPVVLRKVS